jgi:hypothetical protein
MIDCGENINFCFINFCFISFSYLKRLSFEHLRAGKPFNEYLNTEISGSMRLFTYNEQVDFSIQTYVLIKSFSDETKFWSDGWKSVFAIVIMSASPLRNKN